MKKFLTLLMHPAIFWLMALGWTTLIMIVLLKPGNTAIYQNNDLSSFFTSFFSFSISRSDIKEAVGHFILFAVLTMLWMQLLIMYFSRTRATLLAIGIAVALATGTEIGQYFINRGSLFIDLLANFSGILTASMAYRYLRKNGI